MSTGWREPALDHLHNTGTFCEIQNTFIVLLMKFNSISEHYNRRMDEAFAGLSGYHRIVDDVFIYDSDTTQHTDHVQQLCNNVLNGR